MNANVGNVDRAIRIAIGIALIAAALFTGWAVFDNVVLKYGAMAVGLVMLATATLRLCPIYSVLGIKTCRV